MWGHIDGSYCKYHLTGSQFNCSVLNCYSIGRGQIGPPIPMASQASCCQWCFENPNSAASVLSANNSCTLYNTTSFVAKPGYVTQLPNPTPAPTSGILTWHPAALPIAQDWSSVAFGSGKFVAIASSNVSAYSIDGINWQTATLPNWSRLVFYRLRQRYTSRCWNNKK